MQSCFAKQNDDSCYLEKHNSPLSQVPLYIFNDTLFEKQRETFNFSLNNIANMDETPIWADMPSGTTMEGSGSKIVPVKTTGHDEQRITAACLAVNEDISKMKPFILIPGKIIKSEISAVKGIIISRSVIVFSKRLDK